MSRKTFRERSPLLIGILSILAITAATTFSFFINRIPAVNKAYAIEAEFADAAGLNPENQVRVAGIKVGIVKKVELDGDKVVVTMEVDDTVKIPADAGAEIKLATVLGNKFVDIEGVGSAPYLAEGDRIPVERTAIPYEIYQAANEGTAVVEDLDGALLNDLLVELTDLTRIAKDGIANALDGLNDLGRGLNANQSDLRSVLKGARDLTKLLADEGDEIVRLVDASNNVLGSLARQREEVQSLLVATKQMAGELTSIIRHNRKNLDSILTKLHKALVVLDKNVKNLDIALEFAGPSVRYLGSIFQQGRWGDIFSCAIVLTGGCGG